MEGKRNKIQAYLDKKSESFEILTGETFTRREIVIAHIAIIVFFLSLGIAGFIENML